MSGKKSSKKISEVVEVKDEVVPEESPTEETDETPEEPGKKKAPRKKPTLDSHLEKYNKLIEILDEEIDRKQRSREPGIRTLQSTRKIILDMKNEVPKIAHGKYKKKTPSTRASPFSMKCRVSKELAGFMSIPQDSTPSRNEITTALGVYINLKPTEKRENVLKWKHLNPDGKRNLQDKENGMIIRPDKKLSALLGYEQYVKDVKEGKVYKKITNKQTGEKEETVINDVNLTYDIMQRLIKKHIFTLKDEEVKKEEDYDLID